MSDTPRPSSHAGRDDFVLWIVITFCLIVPVGLASFWALAGYWYPPMLLAVLLGIAVAALTYRYLGGASGNQFAVGLLKVTGSAALLVGTIWFANDGLSKQMDVDNLPRKLKAATADLSRVSSDRDELRNKVRRLEDQVAKLTSDGNKDLLERVEGVSPGDDTALALIAMAKAGQGPFSRTHATKLRVTVTGSPAPGRFVACDDMKLRNAALTLSPKTGAQDGQYSSVKGVQAGSIQMSVCQQPDRRFDVQVACEDGLVLFPDHIQGCGRDRAVKWRQPHGERVFEVLADVVSA